MMTRRVEGATGSALNEIGQRSRRQQSKKLTKRRRKQEIQAEVTAAKFIEKEHILSVNPEHVATNHGKMSKTNKEIV